MGRSANPVDQYRRAQRQKEIKKNKVTRLKQRDDKVAATKTVDDVGDDISQLERKKKFQEGYLDASDSRRLERLRKELRIVNEATERREKEEAERRETERIACSQEKSEYDRSREGVERQNSERYRHARMSVYYDAMLNPFGAPPPGKPALYHSMGGGTTMDVRRACVPKELLEKEESDAKAKSNNNETGEAKVAIKRKRKWDDSAADKEKNEGGKDDSNFED